MYRHSDIIVNIYFLVTVLEHSEHCKSKLFIHAWITDMYAIFFENDNAIFTFVI